MDRRRSDTRQDWTWYCESRGRTWRGGTLRSCWRNLRSSRRALYPGPCSFWVLTHRRAHKWRSRLRSDSGSTRGRMCAVSGRSAQLTVAAHSRRQLLGTKRRDKQRSLLWGSWSEWGSHQKSSHTFCRRDSECTTPRAARWKRAGSTGMSTARCIGWIDRCPRCKCCRGTGCSLGGTLSARGSLQPSCGTCRP